MPLVNLRCQDNCWEVYGFWLYELLKHDSLTDLRFVTMDSSGENVVSFNAHQFLFTNQSPLLSKLFLEARNKQNVSDPVVLTLPGVEPASVYALMSYFYFGVTDLHTQDDLEDICFLLGIDSSNLFERCNTDVKWQNHPSGELLLSDEPSSSSAASTPSNSPKKKKSKTSVKGPSTIHVSEHQSEPSDESLLVNCGECRSIFSSNELYEDHMEGCSLEANLEEGIITQRILQCNFCNETYINVINMKNHSLIHFKDALCSNLPSSPPFKCPDCVTIFEDQSILLKHYSFSHCHIYKHASETDLQGIPLEM